MLHALLTFVNDYAPELSEKRTLLAVSGGVDSMVLAELFHRAKFSFAIAHCNFGLRGAESEDDEVSVRHWSEEHNVIFHTRKFETAQRAEKDGVSIQMAARDLRYAWFEELIQEFKYDYLATAHHADDNIETVLLNLTRGTGLPGLLGIAPVKGEVVRPLLFVSKNEILDFAQKAKIAWREDSSNATDTYRRNLLRHQVLPVLQEINPSLHRTFNQNLERLRAVDSLVGGLLLEWRRKAVRIENDGIYISISTIQKANEPAYILHEILQEYGFNYAQTKQVVASLGGVSGKQFFSSTHSLIKDREDLIVELLRQADDFHSIFIQEGSAKITLPGNMSLIITRTPLLPNMEFRADAQTAYFNAAKLRFPLRMRPSRAGDWLQPFGMGGKSKKVSDLLVDAKVPINRKKDFLVLADAEQNVVWVLGLRTDERFRVNSKTTEILKFEILKS